MQPIIILIMKEIFKNKAVKYLVFTFALIVLTGIIYFGFRESWESIFTFQSQKTGKYEQVSSVQRLSEEGNGKNAEKGDIKPIPVYGNWRNLR